MDQSLTKRMVKTKQTSTARSQSCLLIFDFLTWAVSSLEEKEIKTTSMIEKANRENMYQGLYQGAYVSPHACEHTQHTNNTQNSLLNEGAVISAAVRAWRAVTIIFELRHHVKPIFHTAPGLA